MKGNVRSSLSMDVDDEKKLGHSGSFRAPTNHSGRIESQN